MMYRIEKVLNHNTVMAIHQDDHKEVLIRERESDSAGKLQKESK